MTVLYFCRFLLVKTAAFSVVSTAKPVSFPSFMMAVFPAGIEECRKPAVFENTSTRFSGVTVWAVATRLQHARAVAPAILKRFKSFRKGESFIRLIGIG
ncbi:hypothetical protein D3C86_1675910 [compost metagenome]